MDKNYVEVDGTVLVNLRDDTLSSASQIAEGVTGHLRTGEKVTGTGGGTNVLSGKILAANGDSICRGVGNNDVGYADIIGADNNMTVQNIGVGGATIATGTAASHYISTSISEMRADADYILLEGGVNDPDFGVSLGTLTEGYTATLDTTTFAGGFETMLKNALARFPGKFIGYIFVHKCGSFSANYYNIAKQACEKWGVPYCDLNTKVPPLGYIDAYRTAYTNSGDGFHPNAAGYNAFYVPLITAWLKNNMLS